MSDPREALKAIGQLTDAEIDIGNAALQLARVDAPDADWQGGARHLSDLAQATVKRASTMDGEDLPARAAALSEVLAGDFGYTGDLETYDDPANTNLIRVTERRRGLPVALGVIWLHAARAAGWGSHGVDFPAHFLVSLEGRKTQVVVDVFNGGQVMSARALRDLLKRVEGENAELRPGLLQPMSTRRVLLRLQNNITSRRLAARDVPGALACTENMLRFAPEEANLWREAGNLNQTLDHLAAAMRCYERCLALIPEGEYATQTRSKIAELRSRLN